MNFNIVIQAYFCIYIKKIILRYIARISKDCKKKKKKNSLFSSP